MTTSTLFADLTAETDAADLIHALLGGQAIEEPPAPTWREFDDREDREARLAIEMEQDLYAAGW